MTMSSEDTHQQLKQPAPGQASGDGGSAHGKSSVDSSKPLSAIDRIKPQLMDQLQSENDGRSKRNSPGSSSSGFVRGSSPRRGSKDLLASAGINIERRRGSLQTPNYRIENNQIIVEGKDGTPEQRFEILEIHEKPGKFKRALPALPLPLAILCCILNFVLPGSGTLLGGSFARCSSRDTEQVKLNLTNNGARTATSSKLPGDAERPLTTGDAVIEDEDPTPPLSKQEKFSLNVGAAVLQLLGTPIFLIGWIWSMNWGIVMVSLAMQKRIKAREAENMRTAEVGGKASMEGDT